MTAIFLLGMYLILGNPGFSFFFGLLLSIGRWLHGEHEHHHTIRSVGNILPIVRQEKGRRGTPLKRNNRYGVYNVVSVEEMKKVYMIFQDVGTCVELLNDGILIYPQ